jgi:steroid 5-alpha reductase family enzyme
MSVIKPSILRLIAVLFVSASIVFGISIATAPATLALFDWPAMLVLAAFAFGIQWLAFIPAYLLQTEKFYDLVGSTSFIALLSMCLLRLEALSWYQLVLAAMVGIWAIRLGAFLFMRVTKDGADKRFDHIKPDPWVFFTSWTVQGLWVFLTSAAVTTALLSINYVELNSTMNRVLLAFGALLWLGGFIFEVIADTQKRKFKQQANKATPFITSGLWKYSRHPNYFGEIMLWFGAALFAMPALGAWQYVVLISPFFVTFLLVYISGIPILEKNADKRFGELQAYQRYKANTSLLVPWFS